jgi:hypothetical protein
MNPGSRTWTLAELLSERCIEVGNCWEWQGNVNSGGHPMMSFQAKPTLVRRVAWCLAHSLTLRDIEGLRLWNTCCNRMCINPKCTRAGSYQEMHRAMVASGRSAASPQKRAACARAKRAASPRSMDDIRSIRRALSNGETISTLAQRYQCSASLIEKIKANRCWRESVPTASVFSLGAA